MDRASPESDKEKRGFRETLRFYWYRATSAFRAMFTSKQGSDDLPESHRNSRTNSNQFLVEADTQHEVADALSVSGAFVRRWERLAVVSQEQKDNFSTFRVASYNVLCQQTFKAMPQLYAHLDSESPFRSWTHRWELLINEIHALKADVLCLQEIPADTFSVFFKPLLESMGYEVLFFEKTMEAHNHGLVLAVMKEKFKIETHETIEFFQKEDTVLDRGNIGQLVRVMCRKTKSSFLLAHTHLLFDPNSADTKFAQIAYLLSRVHQCRKDDEPIICLGDFNIEPASQLYEYITTGSLNATAFSITHGSGQIPVGSAPLPYSDFLYDLPRETFVHTMMDRSGEIKSDLFDLLFSINTTLPNQFNHQLNLTSVHAPQEPSTVCSFHAHMANSDYIFYDAGNTCSSSLTLTRRLALPSVDDLQGAERWPNEKIPSDHICLLAEFALTK